MPPLCRSAIIINWYFCFVFLQLVFRCVICKDFEYNKVMPTFHNWKTGGKRVGLIFQTAADGRVFDRGIMGVLVELSAGMHRWFGISFFFWPRKI